MTSRLMTMEVLLVPMIVGASGYILYTLRDFFKCLIFASICIEELGSFMEVSMDILKEHVWNKNWTIGGLSMTKVSSDMIRLNNESELIALDAGFYIGRYKRKWMIVTITDKQLSGFGDWVPRHPLIKIVVFRWNKEVLMDFVREAKAEEKPIDTFTTGRNSERIRGRKRSGFDGIFLPGNMSEEIQSFVMWFCSPEGEHWYRDMKQPYKVVFLFHGKAGTGKTALARAIADLTHRSLTHVRLVSTRDSVDISHETVGYVAGSNNEVILFDEIDKLFLEENKEANKIDPATLLGLLNGDLLDGQIIVLTANELSYIPEQFRTSFLRSRRIDRIYEFSNPTEDQKEKACWYYGVDYDEEVKVKETMADVMDIIMRRCQHRKELRVVAHSEDRSLKLKRAI